MSNVISLSLCSFIRLCDYLVVTMLHNLTFKSVSHILNTLHEQLSKPVEIHNLAESIPEDVEEQEKMLTKIYETVGYTPTHYTPRRSMVQMTGSGLFQGTPSRSRSQLTPSRLRATPSVSWWIERKTK